MERGQPFVRSELFKDSLSGAQESHMLGFQETTNKQQCCIFRGDWLFSLVALLKKIDELLYSSAESLHFYSFGGFLLGCSRSHSRAHCNLSPKSP